MRTTLAVVFVLTTAALDAEIKVAEGYHAAVFASALEDPRMLLVLEDGTVLVSRPAMNDVLAMRDRNGDGRADEVRTAVSSIERAHGLAMRGRTLYVAGVKKIVAADRLPDGSFGAPRDVVSDLPDGGQHPDRAIGCGPDGKLYVSIGSSCTDCTESNPEHATLLQLDADGGNRRVYARGLRNLAGFGWHPETGELWGTDQGLVRIGDGLTYDTDAPALELPAGAAPRGFAFHRGAALSVWKNSVARIRFKDGQPAGREAFITGVDLSGVAVADDGALYFSDERNGVVYRVARGRALPPTMISSSSETSPVLSKAFRVEKLRAPESVIHDEEQDVYFVSNVDGPPTERDGNGFISRVSPDGRVLDLKFIDGLNAPKGLAIRGTELWVSDIDLLRSFDRVTGAALKTIDLQPHGAVFLNDVAIGPDEAVYATDADFRIRGRKERVRVGDGRIFRLGQDDQVTVALAGEELRSPSGIVLDGTRFLVAQAYGHEILSWQPGGYPKAVLRGPGAFHGIVVLPNGSVIVSSHHDEGLHIGRAGELEPLFARKPTPAGIGFDRKRNRLIIPSLEGDWLEAWNLPPMNAPQTTSAKDGRLEMARR
jgi:glucose/arabinose dehydrogenase